MRMGKIKRDNLDNIIEGEGNIILSGIVSVPSAIIFAILFAGFGDIYTIGFQLRFLGGWKVIWASAKRRDCIVLDWASQVNICLTLPNRISFHSFSAVASDPVGPSRDYGEGLGWLEGPWGPVVAM
eukprot:g68679.t1